VQNLIATFKSNPNEMIGKVITGVMGQNRSGKEVSKVVQNFSVKSKANKQNMS
jgi:hypothetical protein